jgi:hypothetical protein
MHLDQVVDQGRDGLQTVSESRRIVIVTTPYGARHIWPAT